MGESHITRELFSDRADFRRFHERDEASFVVIGGLYAALLGALVLAAFAVSLGRPAVSVPLSILAFLLIGWAQFSLGNGMHEAVHHNLRNRKSDRLAAILTAYPIGLTMNYRKVHLLHHRHLGTDLDPDLGVYVGFPSTKLELLRWLLWSGCGIPAALQFVSLMLERQPKDLAGRGGSELFWFVGVQLVILLAFVAAFGNPVYYVVFWILPIMTIGKLLSGTRTLCEHSSPHGWVVRTITGSRWQTWVMGAFDFNFHGEHHLYPSVPYANLQRLHQRHEQYRQAHPEYRPFEGRFEVFEGGYLALLAHWFRTLPWRAGVTA
jgi:fatty acid desaturase